MPVIAHGHFTSPSILPISLVTASLPTSGLTLFERQVGKKVHRRLSLDYQRYQAYRGQSWPYHRRVHCSDLHPCPFYQPKLSATWPTYHSKPDGEQETITDTPAK